MKKWVTVTVISIIAAVILTGCGSKLKDGVYTGESSSDERGAVGEITLEIEAGKIVNAEYQTRMEDGNLKDEDYGKVDGVIKDQAHYDQAQTAVQAMPEYAAALVETQDVTKVDAISGATNTYNQFVEAANNALAEAK